MDTFGAVVEEFIQRAVRDAVKLSFQHAPLTLDVIEQRRKLHSVQMSPEEEKNKNENL